MTTNPPSPLTAGPPLLTLAEQGRTCALAVSLQRDLHQVASRHQGLFAGRPFDPALISSVAMSVAFTAPEYTAAQLRVTAWTVLWVFAADWQIDYLAETEDDLRALADSCLAVADGNPPRDGHPLARLLADIRRELSNAPTFAALKSAWRQEVERMFGAMVREWGWKTAEEPGADRRHAPPTLEEYLDNADNAASVLVSVTHWVSLGAQGCLDHFDDLRVASREVQRAVRLINDLATYERDLQWGDLNALMLVSESTEVNTRLTALIEGCRHLIQPLEVTCPRQAAFLQRQIGFTGGFYQLADFWGAL